MDRNRFPTMTTASSNTTVTKLGSTQALVIDDVLRYIEYSSPAISLVIGSPGLIFNIINTVIFLKLGVRDCMSLCLLSLSLTDNASLLFGLMSAWCRLTYSIAATTGTFLYLDPLSVWVLLVQCQFCFYDLSTYTTVFISLERCACVMLPFRFKELFTYGRSVVVLTLLYTFTFLLHVFFFAFAGFRPVLDPRTNATRLVMWNSPRKKVVDDYIQPLNNIFLASLSLTLILITSGIMVTGLVKSAEFQEKSNAKALTRKMGVQTRRTSGVASDASLGRMKITSRSDTGTAMDSDRAADHRPKSQRADVKEELKAKNKNMRLARMVTVLAIICFVCNSVRFGVMVALYMDFELRATGKLSLTVHVISGLAFVTQVINCSVNTVVYLTCNPSYTRAFRKLFRQA
ncbi:unnamed protein product [Lymnaea stagnalis]|uniref:G-protein coupled receptors family 1 profile domain-containing protein n=1 Tax=Lymnaea stagnalis TaxID=6523 RepID=A0AAV2H9W8_LYMST